jgi:SAM-dependent methyltransferase
VIDKKTKCPVCGSSSLTEILSMPSMPVFCNVLWDSREEAESCDRGDILLGYCRECTFVFNTVFDPALVRYSQRYDNCLHFSGRFRDYADSLADRLVARHDLHDKLVVDVGCGKGDFLKLLCEKGPNRGVGYDPSFEAREDIAVLGDVVKIVNDYYSGAYAGHGGDFLCCRHVLEHIEKPGDLLDEVRMGLADRPGVPVFFEVPNGAYTIDHVFVWDVIYEHPCYFTRQSMRRLFETSGFSVTSVDEEFEGQYLGMHAETAGAATDGKQTGEQLVSIDAFTRAFDDLVSTWQEELSALERDGRKAVIWGAGSKGVTFLNLLDRERRVEYAVDVSPNKLGKFVAGSGQEIVSPDFLKDFAPDDILVMNPVYEREIASQLAAIGVNARVRSL